jgi:uncharacterized RDD family membrane protein YckC
MESTGMVHYCGFWRRFLAYFIDNAIVGTATYIGAFVVVFPIVGISSIAGGHAGAAMGSMLAIFLVTPIALAAYWLYFALLESSARQATVGKMALNMIVTDEDGRRLTFGRATGRYFAKILSTMIFDIGFIMVAFTAKKQGLHDIIAGTLVVRKP